MAQQPKKTRIQRLIEAIKAKKWHDANQLVAGILESKVMARLNEERKMAFNECPVDGDGGSPMSDMKKEDADKDDDGEPIEEGAAERSAAAANLRKARNGSGDRKEVNRKFQRSMKNRPAFLKK